MLHPLLSSRSPLRGVVFALALLLSCTSTLRSQTNTGAIRGVVYDETGAVIPGVSVSAVEESRGVARSTTTSETGEFVFSHVDPGTYSLSFEVENFTTLTIEALEVRVGGAQVFHPNSEWP